MGNRRPIPYLSFRLKIQQLHPDWSYILWTDDLVKEYAMYNRCDYEQYHYNPTIQADMLRYQIIHDFGGVYLDIDFEPLKSMDELFNDNSIDFYCCNVDYRRHCVCNGFFASKPQSKTLQLVRMFLNKRYRLKNYDKQNALRISGPMPFGISVLNCIKKKIENIAIVPADKFYSKTRDDSSYFYHHGMKSWVDRKNPVSD